jgi:hypothetical protein
MALFGPVVSLRALLLPVRVAITRSLDRQFAAGYAVFVVATPSGKTRGDECMGQLGRINLEALTELLISRTERNETYPRKDCRLFLPLIISAGK